jgi:thiamine pyrophosphate-dependent acetolactate synthase large subunit-like protein
MFSERERPAAGAAPPELRWASDAFAEMLRRLEIPFVALNPGASYRGLHDSLVNYLGNERPQIIVCLHEEHAVAVAHGYAKVSGRPMAAALHSNVGLMHATMALYNAWCDRVPLLAIGATGPVDAAARRPWIDWIHTSADQGALVRPYVKWDDQPASAQAAVDALARASLLTRSYPPAPVYVCLDAAVQEAELDPALALPDPARHQPPAPPAPVPDGVSRAAELLAGAERPLILVGRVSRDRRDWDARVQLAERLGAAVLTDLKVGAGFPTAHRNHPAPPGTFLGSDARELIARADVVLSLDWVDLGAIHTAAQVISASADYTLHNGWSKDHLAPAAVDVRLTAHPDLVVAALNEALPDRAPAHSGWPPARLYPDASGSPLAAAVHAALGGDICLIRLPLGWDGSDLRATDPLDYLGQDGGAGLGSGPGMAVGAALALASTGNDRLAVAILGDGDFLMGASALWTAAHYRLPLLVVVANNRSFGNDEVHQERVARQRGRPVENRWIGQHIRDPDPDLAALARSLGLHGIGPVTDPGRLTAALSEAAEAAHDGSAVVVDVRTN